MGRSDTPPRSAARPPWALAAQGVFSVVALAAGAALIAGRLDYAQGWIYAGLWAVSAPVLAYLFRHRGALMRERLRPGPGVKPWDRVLVQIIKLAMVGVFVVGALDRGRHGWSPPPPLWSYPLSVAALAVSTGISVWSMHVNEFFSSHVRIQTDRGHTVTDRGPYRAVRHPGYVTMIVAGFATALVLGSLWALVPAGTCALTLVVRTALEDRTLRRELPGYAEYAERVRYRLIPGLW